MDIKNEKAVISFVIDAREGNDRTSDNILWSATGPSLLSPEAGPAVYVASSPSCTCAATL